jgi:N-acetyl-anhydromuramyl-L-alanine amidase AmpD
MIIPFLRAKHFKKGPRSKVDLVVIHSAEIGESLQGAEALMRVAATTEREVSWHYAADANSVTQSVREDDIAFHAPGANSNGIGIELTGQARQSAAEWDDDFSRSMLALAVELIAGICARWNIPAELVDRQGLLDGRRGITTHAMVSQAFKKSDHMDPGAGFPINSFVDRVAAALQSTASPSAAPPPPAPAATRPILSRGAKGTAVAELQRRLNAAGAAPALDVDGDFGEHTENALRTFQAAHALAATAIADAATWAALPA